MCVFVVSHTFRDPFFSLKLPEGQGTPWSEQARYLKYKSLQWDSNPERLSS